MIIKPGASELLKKLHDRYKNVSRISDIFRGDGLCGQSWDLFSCDCELNDEFVETFHQWIYWPSFSKTVHCKFNITEDLLYKFRNKIDWSWVLADKILSEKILRKIVNDHTIVPKTKIVKWNYISSRQKLSEEFIRDFADDLNWELIAAHQDMSEKFVVEMQMKGYL